MAIEKVRVVVYGASGYTSGELLRLFQTHPQVEVRAVVSSAHQGATLSSLHGHLGDELGEMKTISTDDIPSCDCVFFATPSGVAMKTIARVLVKNTKVIDLSPDFRIKDVTLWQKWYGMVHTEREILAESVYGLPEVNRQEIRKARVIANPGCYATTVQLALLPLLHNPAYKDVFAKNELVVDAKSGISGAGRKATTHLLLAEAGEDFTCYAAEGHRHQPEIEESLREASGTRVKIRFVPHLLPVSRGIFADAYVPLRGDGSATVDRQGLLSSLHKEYVKFYESQSFVRVLPLGETPRIKQTRGSNYCHVALFAAPDSQYVQVCSVLDNLVKGAAGQAIQNMNIVFGLDETMGLSYAGVSP